MMNYEAMPILKVEVERLKHTIMTNMGVFGSEMGDALDAAISKAFNDYPLKQEVKRIAHESLTAEINHFFKYGDGNKAIIKSVNKMFSPDNQER